MLERLAVVSVALGPLVGCGHAGETGKDAGVRPAETSDHDLVTTCPVAPPEPARPCDLPESVACSFGDPCHFDRYACSAGRWTETTRDGAAGESCPSEPPSTGSTCASCGTSFTCRYDAGCASGPASTTSICSGGHWLTGTGECSDAAGDAGDATDGGGGSG